MSPNDTARSEDEALEPTEAETDRRVVAPLVDIYEDDGGLIIVADMPGVKKDGVSASVEGGVLTVEGRVEPGDTRADILYREYEPADYHRCFALGESIDANGITAELKDGVLTVRLPKAETAKTRRIAVSGA